MFLLKDYLHQKRKPEGTLRGINGEPSIVHVQPTTGLLSSGVAKMRARAKFLSTKEKDLLRLRKRQGREGDLSRGQW